MSRVFVFCGCLIACVSCLVVSGCNSSDSANTEKSSGASTSVAAGGAKGKSPSKEFAGANNIDEVPEKYKAMVRSYQSQNQNKTTPKMSAPPK